MKPHKDQRNRPVFQFVSRLLYPVCRIFNLANTMQEVANAMMACSLNGYGKPHVGVGDIKKLAQLL